MYVLWRGICLAPIAVVLWGVLSTSDMRVAIGGLVIASVWAWWWWEAGE